MAGGCRARAGQVGQRCVLPLDRAAPPHCSRFLRTVLAVPSPPAWRPRFVTCLLCSAHATLPLACTPAVAARISRILAAVESSPMPTKLAPPTTDWLLALAPAASLAPLRLLLQNANNWVRWLCRLPAPGCPFRLHARLHLQASTLPGVLLPFVPYPVLRSHNWCALHCACCIPCFVEHAQSNVPTALCTFLLCSWPTLFWDRRWAPSAKR